MRFIEASDLNTENSSLDCWPALVGRGVTYGQSPVANSGALLKASTGLHR